MSIDLGYEFEPSRLTDGEAILQGMTNSIIKHAAIAHRAIVQREVCQIRQDRYSGTLIHTPSGPVKIGVDSVEYPALDQDIPETEIGSILGAEPDELHHTFGPLERDGEDRRIRVGSFRFSERDEAGNNFWVQRSEGHLMKQGRIKYDLEEKTILGGRIGTILVANTRILSLMPGNHYDYKGRGYDEEEPGKIVTSQQRVRFNERFARLAIAISEHMGGGLQLSQATDSSPLLKRTDDSPKRIARRLVSFGYNIQQSERVADEKTDAGLVVLRGAKETEYGVETVIAEEGYSSFYYTRNQKDWYVHKGILLNQTVTLGDLDYIARPLGSK